MCAYGIKNRVGLAGTLRLSLGALAAVLLVRVVIETFSLWAIRMFDDRFHSQRRPDVTEIDDVLLETIDTVRRQAGVRQHRAPIPAGDPQHDVPTAQIVEVVGKRAQRMHDLERVPAGLELQALGLYASARQQIGDFEWQ